MEIRCRRCGSERERRALICIDGYFWHMDCVNEIIEEYLTSNPRCRGLKNKCPKCLNKFGPDQILCRFLGIDWHIGCTYEIFNEYYTTHPWSVDLITEMDIVAKGDD
jgi:hypothetical protein